MLDGIVAEELLAPLAVTDRSIRLADDRFWTGRIFTVGFLAVQTTLDETALGGVENFSHTYVTQDYQGMWPDVIEDTDEAFYNFSHSFDPVLTSAFFKEADFIYSADLEVVSVAPPLFTDLEIFYVPGTKAAITPDLVTDEDIVRANIIRRDGDPLVLLTEFVVDTDVTYAPTAARALTPGVVNEYYPDGDNIYAPSNAGLLAPLVFNAADVVYSFTIFSQLNPSRIVDADTLIGPEVRTPGRMDLFVEDNVFYTPSIRYAPLAAPFVDESDAIYVPIASERPPMHPYDFIVDFEDTFYIPAVTIHQGLAPFLWVEVDVVLIIPAVILGQVIAPTARYNDSDIFYDPILPPTVTSATFTDADNFFTPMLVYDQVLSPSWFVESSTFPEPSLGSPASFGGLVSLDGPIPPTDTPLTVILIEG